MILNPFVIELIGLATRILLLIGGTLGYSWSETAIAQTLNAVAVLGTVAWAAMRMYRSRRKLLVAAATDYPITEHQVEHLVSIGANPAVATPKSDVPRV